jgi:hypothetical protein
VNALRYADLWNEVLQLRHSMVFDVRYGEEGGKYGVGTEGEQDGGTARGRREELCGVFDAAARWLGLQ